MSLLFRFSFLSLRLFCCVVWAGVVLIFCPAYGEETPLSSAEEKLLKAQETEEKIQPESREKPPKTEKPQTTITCKGNLDMSYGKNIAIFHDDVLVNDPRMKMKADKMKVFFDPETRAIKKVIALGHVQFKKEDKSAKSRKAVYTAKDGRVVLTGKPMVKKGQSIMTGEMITFFRDDNRMLIEPTAKVIFYTSDQKEFEEGWMK